MVQALQITSFLILPILSFIVLIFFGKRFKKHSSTIALGLMGLMLFNALIIFANSIFYNSGNHHSLTRSFEWFSTGALNIYLGYYVDNITVIMLMVVALIGFLAFRFFDIVKPFPARYCERFHGGWGIMLDDLVAGIYAALSIRIILWMQIPF